MRGPRLDGLGIFLPLALVHRVVRHAREPGGGEQDLASTIANLRQITDNLRDLTEDAKRYPSNLLFGEPPKPLPGRQP